MVGLKKGTLISTSLLETKPIEEIAIGDKVLSYDEATTSFIEQEVVNIITNRCSELTKYTFDNGTELIGCEDLVFLTTSGWKENIEIDDEVLMNVGTTKLINEELIGEDNLFELDIEPIDNYIANGIIVHNLQSLVNPILHDEDTGDITADDTNETTTNTATNGTYWTVSLADPSSVSWDTTTNSPFNYSCTKLSTNLAGGYYHNNTRFSTYRYGNKKLFSEITLTNYFGSSINLTFSAQPSDLYPSKLRFRGSTDFTNCPFSPPDSDKTNFPMMLLPGSMCGLTHVFSRYWDDYPVPPTSKQAISSSYTAELPLPYYLCYKDNKLCLYRGYDPMTFKITTTSKECTGSPRTWNKYTYDNVWFQIEKVSDITASTAYLEQSWTSSDFTREYIMPKRLAFAVQAGGGAGGLSDAWGNGTGGAGGGLFSGIIELEKVITDGCLVAIFPGFNGYFDYQGSTPIEIGGAPSRVQVFDANGNSIEHFILTAGDNGNCETARASDGQVAAEGGSLDPSTGWTWGQPSDGQYLKYLYFKSGANGGKNWLGDTSKSSTASGCAEFIFPTDLYGPCVQCNMSAKSGGLNGDYYTGGGGASPSHSGSNGGQASIEGKTPKEACRGVPGEFGAGGGGCRHLTFTSYMTNATDAKSTHGGKPYFKLWY